VSVWREEEIPNESLLYMRAHQVYKKTDGTLKPGVFKDQGDSMSTDWDRYSTPQETLDRARVPAQNAVISLNVGEVRAIDPLSVKHDLRDVDGQPVHRAHTSVFGEKTPEVRLKLRRIHGWAIPFTP
jgi:hypothetical protein